MGRDDELNVIVGGLERDVPPFAVVHVHGPPGIGKSTFVAELARRAQAIPRNVISIDGREVDPSPAGMAAAVGTALDVPPPDALAALAGHSGVVLILDTYEALASLDRWVREELVPSLVDDALVVLAGRTPPTAPWRLDRGWSELLREIQLRDLSERDSRSLLAMHDVPSEHHGQILGATGGHPLALELAAGAWGQGEAAGWGGSIDPRVMDDLLDAFLEGVPSPTHRQALEVAAFTGVATEELLRTAVDTPAPTEMFEWLRSLSFTEPTTRGLAVHDLVREILLADLHWRDQDRFAQLHATVTEHLEQRMARSGGAARRRAMLDLLQLYRFNPLTRSFYDWTDPDRLHVEPALETDHDTILALAKEYEGAESERITKYWLDRQPDAFRVFRDPSTPQASGFIADLLLGDTPGDEVDEDPIVAAAWRHVRRHGALRAGERFRIMRFWVAAGTYQGIETNHLVSTEATLDWFETPSMSWAFAVLADPEGLAPMFTFLDFHPVDDPRRIEVGDHTFGMFARDFRVTSRRGWRDLLTDRRVSRAEPEHVPSRAPRLLVLSRDDFDVAVREALRGIARAGGLDDNPLLRSRVVADVADDQGPEAALMGLIRRATTELSGHPRDETVRRCLELTYLDPAPNQEAAAERLSLSFSTFRRRLAEGIDHVSEWLWKREVQGHELAS